MNSSFRSKYSNGNTSSRNEASHNFYFDINNNAFNTMNLMSDRSDEQSIFAFKTLPTSPKFNTSDENSVVNKGGVYEYLERQYKVHCEKERVERIKKSGNTYRYCDFKEDQDLMLLDTNHRNINEKKTYKLKRKTKELENKHYIVQDISKCQPIGGKEKWK